MRIVTIRDLRTRPRQTREALRRGEEAVLTVNGQPVALMVPVSRESLDETLRALRRAKAQMALVAMRSAARAVGTDGIGMRAIDVVVAATRRTRRRQRCATGR